MNDAKYIGMDVHQATICAAVRDSGGNLVMEATLETKAETILEFVHGLRGTARKRRRQLIGIANVCRLSEGRQGHMRGDKSQHKQTQHRVAPFTVRIVLESRYLLAAKPL
jgi:hypothetical protein